MKKLPTRILGIDFGLKRFGLAISNELNFLATPVKTLQVEKKLEKTVSIFLEEYENLKKQYECDIEEIIIGLPLLLSGNKGLIADEVLHFVSLLKEQLSIPIKTWDERLTSKQAERSLKEGKMSRKKRTKVIDTVAAVLILQSYLDSKVF